MILKNDILPKLISLGHSVLRGCATLVSLGRRPACRTGRLAPCNRRNKGVVLVEVLLAATILAMILVPTVNFFVTAIETSWFASREIRAQALVREAFEALRSVRERDWVEIVDGDFRLDVVAGEWQLIADTSGETIGPFTREILIEPVYRDSNDQIVTSGGTLDPSTKSVTVSLLWQALRDRSLSFQTYLTRYLDNIVWFETTQAEFDLGQKNYTKTTAVGDGEVVLEGGCAGSPPDVPNIFDDVFHNTWEVHPSAKDNIKVKSQPPGQVYQGLKALELSSFQGADTKLKNVGGICTLGFTHLEFWAYNAADVEQSFGINGKWEGNWFEVILPPQSWEHVSIAYADVSEGGNDENLDFIFFRQENTLPGTIFYLDDLQLTGGAGGFFLQGTFTSQVYTASRETVFNRIAYSAATPIQTSIGFQVATSNNVGGPWVFYGPGGTSNQNDRYTDPNGEGIWLGNNYGRYCRYKAYLFSDDGESSPTLYDVSINHAP